MWCRYSGILLIVQTVMRSGMSRYQPIFCCMLVSNLKFMTDSSVLCSLEFLPPIYFVIYWDRVASCSKMTWGDTDAGTPVTQKQCRRIFMNTSKNGVEKHLPPCIEYLVVLAVSFTKAVIPQSHFSASREWASASASGCGGWWLTWHSMMG